MTRLQKEWHQTNNFWAFCERWLYSFRWLYNYNDWELISDFGSR